MIEVNIVIDRILHHPTRFFEVLPRIGEQVYLSEREPVYIVKSITHFANIPDTQEIASLPDLHLTVRERVV